MIDLQRQTFNRWTVIGATETQRGNRGQVRYFVPCRCSCGTERLVEANNLKNGKSKSCGCLKSEQSKVRGHGNSFSKRLPSGEAAFNRLIDSYRRNASKNSRSFELTETEFRNLVTSNCTYCNAEPSREFKSRNSTGSFTFNGIDRQDNNIGYTKSNSVPCCYQCNFFKKAMPYEDFIATIQRIYEWHIQRSWQHSQT